MPSTLDIKNLKPLDKVFWVFSLIVFFSIGASILLENYLINLIPLVLVMVFITLVDYKYIFFLFFAALPFSIEIYLPNGLGTDLPTEPLALLLTAVALLLTIDRINHIPSKYVRHPISLVILIHLIWIGFSSITSQDHIISFKFLLAKLWYVIPFFALPFALFKNTLDIERVIKVLIWSSTAAVVIIMIKHAGMGFTFKSINKAAHPIYRNHVIYAALLVIVLPFIYHFRSFAKGFWTRWAWTGLLVLFILATYFSYTRAAHLCVFILVGATIVIKYKLTRLAVYSSLFMGFLFCYFMVQSNKYLDFAPEYKKTITHINFDNLIEATYKMQDISTMERVYRWVAGIQMVKARPILGFGPGCFYPNYKDYAVSSFRTYVSNNPDKSGVHNHYYMTLIEQGIFGLIIILFLCILPILYGESLYHRMSNARDKSLVMAVILSLIVIDAMLLINDLLENDKLGSIFLFNLSILVILDLRHRRQITMEQPEKVTKKNP